MCSFPPHWLQARFLHVVGLAGFARRLEVEVYVTGVGYEVLTVLVALGTSSPPAAVAGSESRSAHSASAAAAVAERRVFEVIILERHGGRRSVDGLVRKRGARTCGAGASAPLLRVGRRLSPLLFLVLVLDLLSQPSYFTRLVFLDCIS